MLAAATGTVQAGGLERGGHNIDLLFEPTPFALDATGTYVMPQRKLDNVVDGNPLDGVGSDGLGGGFTQGVSDTRSYFVPRLGFKAGLGDYADCMVDYSQPWGAHSRPGRDWMGANSNVETKIGSHGYAATCSVKFQAGKGQFRIIGGAFYHQLEGFKERLVAPPFVAVGDGIGRLDLEGDGWGWRIGAAYEIPEIALRTSLVYNSAVRFGNLTGMLDLTQVTGPMVPVYSSASMPESVEFKLQTGIAPGWLAFGSVKWVNWSGLQTIPFCAEASRGLPCEMGMLWQLTQLDLLYRDGWTVSGGVAHRFNDQWSALASLSWDRGTSTTIGHQTDTWLLTTGVAFTPTANAEFRLGGALGVLTSGSSGPDREGVSYTFDNDLVGALSASVKLKW